MQKSLFEQEKNKTSDDIEDLKRQRQEVIFKLKEKLCLQNKTALELLLIVNWDRTIDILNLKIKMLEHE